MPSSPSCAPSATSSPSPSSWSSTTTSCATGWLEPATYESSIAATETIGHNWGMVGSDGGGYPPGPPGLPGPPGPPGPPPWAAPPLPPPGWAAPPWAAPPPPPNMPKAGNERTGPLPLHPMTMSDILDGAFKLYKANATSVLLVAATFVVPVQLVIAFLQRNTLGGRSIFNAFTSDTTAQS